jgi:tetratricopeptide (TPR) repeat protein
MRNLKKPQNKKYRYWLIGLSLFFLSTGETVLFSQTINSLEKIYLKLPPVNETDVSDTIRCQILITLSDNAENGKWQNYTYQLKGLASARLKYVPKNHYLVKFYKRTLARALSNMGYAYQDSTNVAAASGYYTKSLQLYQEIADQRGISDLYNYLASLYLIEKKYDMALTYGEMALELTRELGFPSEIARAAQTLKLIYEHNKNYSKTLEMYDLYVRINDSTNSENIRNEKLKQQSQFELDKKELLKRVGVIKNGIIEQRKKRYYFTIGVGIALFLLVLIVSIYMFVSYKKAKEKEDQIIRLKDDEIKSLQTQMNPYFISTALNSMTEMLDRSEGKDVLKYLTKASKLIRKILEISNAKNISVSKEIEMLSLYIELENLRYGNKVVFSIQADPALDADDHYIPSMVIYPFVEDAILNGLVNKQKVCEEQKIAYTPHLKIDLCRQDEFLKCIIEDNGIGREKTNEMKYAGMEDASADSDVSQGRFEFLRHNNCKIEFIYLKNKNNEALGTKVEILIPMESAF